MNPTGGYILTERGKMGGVWGKEVMGSTRSFARLETEILRTQSIRNSGSWGNAKGLIQLENSPQKEKNDVIDAGDREKKKRRHGSVQKWPISLYSVN